MGLILSETKAFTLSWITWPTRKSESQRVILVGRSSIKILYLSPLCQTLSTAFSMSRKAATTCSPLLKLSMYESQPILDETLALIKEKRKLRWQYSQAHDPLVKTRINQLQKEIKDNLRIESQASWEKFCNDISLETNRTESWHKIKNFLKPKGHRDYPDL